MTALIIFIDNPEHASLEPALEAALPAEDRVKVYSALSDRLRNLTALFAGEKYLYYSHYPNWNDAWDINLYRKRIQIGDAVSERIRQALSDTAEEEPETMLWLSGEASSMAPEMLETAAGLLNDHDLVIGEDPGGSVLLLGFGQKAFTIFESGIPGPVMSDALSGTADAAGITYARIAVPAAPKTLDDLAGLQILPH